MKSNGVTLRALALGCTALVPLSAAQAQTGFTISNGQTATSTQTVSNGGTGRVEEGGKIEVSGSSDFGIHSSGFVDTNTIWHAGLITTSGQYGAGGKVTASTGDAFFLQGGSSTVTIEDGATVSASGTGSNGLYVKNISTIDNAGTITTSGERGYGVNLVGTGNTVTNSGTISTSGDSGHGTVEPYVGVEGRYASSGEVVGEVASLGQSVTLDGVGDKKVGRVIAGANATYRSKNSKLAWKLSLKGTLDTDGTTAVVASFGGELSF